MVYKGYYWQMYIEKDFLHTIHTNKQPFTLKLAKAAVHRSPHYADCWFAEHDYDKEYVSIVGDNLDDTNIHVLVSDGNGNERNSAWYIHRATGTLYVPLSDGEWEEYDHDEYTINPIFAHDREGFSVNMEHAIPAKWQRIKNLEPNCVIFVKWGAFFELYHQDALVYRDVKPPPNRVPLMGTRGESHRFAWTGFPASVVEKETKLFTDKGITVVKMFPTFEDKRHRF